MSHQRLYDVVTLNACMQDPATLAWMIQADVGLPGAIPPGRYPTPEEIRTVIDAISGIRVDYLISETVWEVTVRSRKDVSWATLALRDYRGRDNTAHQFFFKAGWDELIELVTMHLARICGPYVLLPDSGAAPKVIM